jgi:hypothetical protein
LITLPGPERKSPCNGCLSDHSISGGLSENPAIGVGQHRAVKQIIERLHLLFFSNKAIKRVLAAEFHCSVHF